MKIEWQLFRFPFDDPKWQGKALIGGLLGIGSMFLFPISLVLALPLAGYSLRLMRQVIQGSEPALPEWDDWGELFTDGIKAWVVGFVYSLPMLVMTCCFYGSFLLMIPLIAAAEDSQVMVLALTGGMVLFYVLFFVLIAVMMAVMLPTFYFATVALTRLAATGSLNSAFQFGEVVQLGRKGFSNYLLACIGLYGIVGILSVAMMAITYSIVLSCLYPVLMGGLMFYGAVLGGAVFGKAYFHTIPTAASGKDSPTPAPASTAPLKEKTETVEKPKKPRSSSTRKKKTEKDDE
ncbi:MAG: DUF4013 domain-containing protein [Anaerolineae bacterium]|nr:DUF4013 domain-containing protein [Anaerolineae bacterium]